MKPECCARSNVYWLMRSPMKKRSIESCGRAWRLTPDRYPKAVPSGKRFIAKHSKKKYGVAENRDGKRVDPREGNHEGLERNCCHTDPWPTSRLRRAEQADGSHAFEIDDGSQPDST